MKLPNLFKEIVILPPYKEHFSNDNFGSVSLYIKDINHLSKFKNNITVFYNHITTPFRGFKTFNLPNNLYHLFFGKNLGHTKSFIRQLKNNVRFPKIIEVHNRPKSALLISQKIKLSKTILFYHNDPLSFKEASTPKYRMKLLKNCSHICFVSEFLKKRFLIGINPNYLSNIKLSVIYNGVQPLIKKSYFKRNQNIVFVGELSKNKGFDIFLEAAKDLNLNFPHWKIDVFGKQNNKYIKTINKLENITFHGFKHHNYVLKFLNKSSISVIPSVWDEPFGRTLLESINSGASTISSTNGGLKEICKHFKVVKLNKINKKSIYNSIKKLIMSEDERSHHSNNNVSKTPFTLNKISSKLDNLRFKILL